MSKLKGTCLTLTDGEGRNEEEEWVRRKRRRRKGDVGRPLCAVFVKLLHSGFYHVTEMQWRGFIRLLSLSLLLLLQLNWSI